MQFAFLIQRAGMQLILRKSPAIKRWEVHCGGTVQYTFSGREGECDSSMIGPGGIDNRGTTLIDNLFQWPSDFKANFKEAERQMSSRACHSP